MKKYYKLLCALVCIVCILSGCGNSKNNNYYNAKLVQADNGVKNEVYSYLLLYFPDNNGNYLKPESRKVEIGNKTFEELIVNELIRGPESEEYSSSIPKESKLLSIKVKNKTAYVDLNKDFKYRNTGGSMNEIFAIYSIVNSLTELPYIEKVQFSIEGKKEETLSGHMEFDKPFTRNRNLFQRENLTPSEVLKKEMLYEKEGRWVDSYMLMSDDENNPDRKYYDEYVKELQETKDEGLLNTNFAVDGYTMNAGKNTAKVKLNFITNGPGGESIKGPDIYFKVVKINNYWKVDWITAQE